VEFNFGLGAVAVETSPGLVPEMESTDQPNGECDLVESRTTASVHSLYHTLRRQCRKELQ